MYRTSDDSANNVVMLLQSATTPVMQMDIFTAFYDEPSSEIYVKC